MGLWKKNMPGDFHRKPGCFWSKKPGFRHDAKAQRFLFTFGV